MIKSGFKFGMLLQFAVGPICLFVFQTAVSQGFSIAMSAVGGETLIDALFIAASIRGLGAIMNKSKMMQKWARLGGGIILIWFGLSTIISVIGISIVPDFKTILTLDMNNVFLKSIILTLSNPLTIIFWAGVFSAKLVDQRFQLKEMSLFGLGAILSTFVFLSIIAIVGHYTKSFLPTVYLTVFNVVIGVLLIGFGVRTMKGHT